MVAEQQYADTGRGRKRFRRCYLLNKSAFEKNTEANLVDTLRTSVSPIILLVAEDKNTIVGHIMFSAVSLSGHDDLRIMGLAPMAVAPEQQGKGIGSELVRAGLEQCKNLGFGAVIVLGHPTYYPKFGFEPSTKFGVNSEYDVPEEVFMAMELEPSYLRGLSGAIKYSAAFNGA